MKSFVVAALVAAVAAAPQSTSGSECAASADGKFTITTVKADMPSKRGLETSQLSGTLTMSLEDGKLTDQAGRAGYIASNYQFQFDAPVQANALDTGDFALCSNGFLSLKGSTVFYQCDSGGFYNLYSQSIGDQCIAIHIQAMMDGQGSSVSQIPDGQPQASAPASPPPSPPAVTQIPDGQPQASAPAPAVTSPSYPAPDTPAPDTPAPDTPALDSPAPDEPAPGPATSLPPYPHSDTSPPAVTQISDGQPQVTAPPATAPVSNHTSATTPSMPEYTGAAATTAAGVGALVAGFFAVFSFL